MSSFPIRCDYCGEDLPTAEFDVIGITGGHKVSTTVNICICSHALFAPQKIAKALGWDSLISATQKEDVT